MKLAEKAVKATLLVIGGTYLNDLIAFARSVILARLLIPEYFGIVALANFFFFLFSGLKEFNFDGALIHKANPTEKTFASHFVLKIGFALVNLLVVFAISPFLTKLYGPKIVKIIFIFTFFAIFQEASSTPRIFLEKELLFGKVYVINTLKELIKTIIPVIMAIQGFGLWSLVAMGVLDMLVPFFSYIITKTWKISFHANKETIIWFLKFSSYMWLNSLGFILIFQFDVFLVGTLVSAVALGLYVKAYEISKMPTQLITHIVTKVSLPLYSKLKEDRVELSRAFNNFLYLIIRLAFPFSILLFIVAPEFIYIFFGSKWLGSVLLLRLLITYSVLRSIMDDCGSLLIAVGKPKILTSVTLIQSLLMVVFAPIFVYFLKEKGAAIFVGLMEIVGISLIYKSLKDFVDIEYKKNFLPPLFAMGLGFLLVYAIFKNFYISGFMLRLIIKLFLFGCAYILVIILFTGRELMNKFRFVFRALREGD